MTMDELRRQIATTEWPATIRVDGKDVEVRETPVARSGKLVALTSFTSQSTREQL